VPPELTLPAAAAGGMSLESIPRIGDAGNTISLSWPMTRSKPTSFEILGIPIACLAMGEAIDIVSSWARSGLPPRLVTFSNVHMLVEANRSQSFRKLLRATDMNCPDGMPLVWMGKLRSKSMARVCGPDFMPLFCAETADRGYRHFFYGGNEGVAASVSAALRKNYPALQIAGYYTPPFRPLTSEEDSQIIAMINETKPDFVWVALGCPKQERWIAQHRNSLTAGALLAVGMAFDTIAGNRRRAPSVMHNLGLEWFYRLLQEPRRLWRRYVIDNPLFCAYLLRNLVRSAILLVSKENAGAPDAG